VLEDPATLAGLVRAAATRLADAGVERPRQEALSLVGDLTGRSVGEVLLAAGAAPPEGAAEHLVEALDRRAAGEPLAYVSGLAGFRSLLLRVDRRVLIPRPETEGLVDLVLRAVPAGRVVDVGTGSGCLALSLRAESRFAEVVGIDLSPEALDVARANGDRLGLTVRWEVGDLLAPVRDEVFDVVVSNPPYLTAAEYRDLDASVRAWEPKLALVSGEDGLRATEALVEQAGEVLRPGGLLALEVDSSRAARVAALVRRPGWSDVTVTQDLFGRDRYLTARRDVRS